MWDSLRRGHGSHIDEIAWDVGVVGVSDVLHTMCSSNAPLSILDLHKVRHGLSTSSLVQWRYRTRLVNNGRPDYQHKAIDRGRRKVRISEDRRFLERQQYKEHSARIKNARVVVSK